jgi:hypothetical protein
MKMDEQRKAWNKRQAELRELLLSFEGHEEALDLFMKQHAMVHSAGVAQAAGPSFEDELLDNMTEEQIRRIPKGAEHSAAWLVWHMARIEDVTMNLLVAGGPQIFNRDEWFARLRSGYCNTGNAMEEADIASLSAAVDLAALQAYRLAVGRGTREIVAQLRPEQLKQKVDPAGLQLALDEGAVLPAAQGLIDYWSRRTIAGLLLMPPTRHNFIHLNEALRLKA